jgi:monoamine oxidase
VKRRRCNAFEADVLVLGAGAAGISAARALRDAGLTVTVLEARPRIGGRVDTDHSLAPHPVELGAEFIHGERAVTWAHLDRFGFAAIPDANHGFYHVHGQLFHDAEAPVPPSEGMLRAMKARAREHLAAGKPDLSVADFLDRQKDYPFRPSFKSTRLLLNNLIASEKGADLDTMGLTGLLEHDFSGYGEGNYRIREGYARLLGRLAEGLDIRLRQAVRRVEWGRRGAIVQTRKASFAARHVLVTLPLGVLQAGDVRFRPALPGRKRRAIEGVGSASVCKVILRFRQRFWSDYLAVLSTTGATQVWWPSGWGRPDAAPVLTALVGGGDARRLSALGKKGALAEALATLGGMFGKDLRNIFEEGRVVRWHRKRYSKMGYSYLPVGGSAVLRERLAEALPPTLFFAGEATNARQPSTVHGALESGARAAREILAVRGRSGDLDCLSRGRAKHSTSRVGCR